MLYYFYVLLKTSQVLKTREAYIVYAPILKSVHQLF